MNEHWKKQFQLNGPDKLESNTNELLQAVCITVASKLFWDIVVRDGRLLQMLRV